MIIQTGIATDGGHAPLGPLRRLHHREDGLLQLPLRITILPDRQLRLLNRSGVPANLQQKQIPMLANPISLILAS